MRILERLSEGPKKIIWYLGEHPDLLQRYTDLQGLARRTVQLLRRKWEQLRQALRFMVRERRAQRFPESDHKLAQAILFIWGNIPRFASRFRERLYRIRRFRIRTGNRWQVLFERIKLHPAWFLGSAVAVAAIAVTLSLYTIGVTVSYDGMNLGTVASGRVVRQAAADIEDVTCQTLGYDSYTVDTSLLTRKTRIVPRSTVQTKQEFEAKLSRQLGEVAYGYVLYVDDEPVAATEYEGAMEELLEQLKNDRQKHQYSKANPHGKMTVKQLAAKDKGLQSIEVTDQNIGSFNRIARKYGIDFAPFKVKGEKRYMVFFKAPDADAMTAAFKEYTAKQVRKAERPSVLEKLQHFKSLIQAAVVDRTKRKELER